MSRKIKRCLITVGIVGFLVIIGVIYKNSSEDSKHNQEIVVIGQENAKQDSGQSADENEQTVLPEREVELIYVYICGAVQQEGVYEVPKGTRVYEVIELAGGLQTDASTKSINQARMVTDGEQIVIATVAEENATASVENKLISINQASVEQLCEIPGVGESRAKDIIAYREANGFFQTKEDLMNVSGIKEATYGKMEPYIRVE